MGRPCTGPARLLPPPDCAADTERQGAACENPDLWAGKTVVRGEGRDRRSSVELRLLRRVCAEDRGRSSAQREPSTVDHDIEVADRGGRIDNSLELSFCHRREEACSGFDHREYRCDEAL